MMKITFLTPHINIGGGIKIILGYADRLAKKGHEVTVICPQPTFVETRIKGLPIFYPKRVIMNFLKSKPDWIECAANIKYVPTYNEKYIPDADIVLATAWYTAPYVKGYSPRKGSKFYLIQGYESEIFGSEEEVHKTYAYPLKKIVIAAAMAARIDQLLKDDALRHEMGQRAAEDARGRFDLNRQTNDFLDWYQEVIAGWQDWQKNTIRHVKSMGGNRC